MNSDYPSVVAISFAVQAPANVNTVFTSAGLWLFSILSSRSADDNRRAGFGVCGSRFCIDVSAAARREMKKLPEILWESPRGR